MARFMKSALVAFAFSLVGTSAFAQSECQPTPNPFPSEFDLYLHIEPSDSPLDVWCRIQQLVGPTKVAIEFTEQGAVGIKEFQFTGRPTLPKVLMSNFIQSYFPTTEKDAYADNPFKDVLSKTISATLDHADDGQALGFPIDSPYAREKILWTPLIMRVNNVHQSGGSFRLSVRFKPTVARFLEAESNFVDDPQIIGWKNLVKKHIVMGVDTCNLMTVGCTEVDKDAETATVHAPWVFNGLILEAEGPGLANVVVDMFGQLARSPLVESSDMDRYEPAVGSAKIVLTDGVREIIAVATGSDDKVSGTKKILLIEQERPSNNTNKPYFRIMDNWANQQRQQILLKYQPTKKPT